MGNPITPLSGSAPEPSYGPVLLPKGIPQEEPPRKDLLTRTAARLGRAAGSVVERARSVPARVEQAKTRFVLARQRVAENTSAAGIQGENLARKTANNALHRAEEFAGERPLELIAGAAGAAFVVGFALRWRRSNHAARR